MIPGTTEPRLLTCSRCNGMNAVSTNTFSEHARLQEFFAQAHFTALCPECLDEITSLRNEADRVPVDEPGSELIEGVHYYMEKNLVVFTELYHIAKGYCCKSGCRHCAYGYKIEI